MLTISSKVKTVELQNGVKAIDLTPGTDRIVAIVDYQVLMRLVSFLGEGKFDIIKSRLSSKIENTRSLNEMLELLEEEIAFHKTVNIIQTVEMREEQKEMSPDYQEI